MEKSQKWGKAKAIWQFFNTPVNQLIEDLRVQRITRRMNGENKIKVFLAVHATVVPNFF